MNLQFSLSTNVVSGNTSGISQHSEAVAHQDNQLIQAVRSGSELSKLERQGVSFSMGDEQLIKAIDKAVKALQGPTTTLEMSVHEKTHQILVKVLNKDTGELIREIPPEKTLDLVAKMMEIAGILIDEKV
ncbi:MULTISPECIES: flagellar protein FlaG [Paenibacillus]|uniref:flagellar protein FlaG n=1 Tax=Paenibacillus TaxID=44249 RepID=UPI00042E32B9|nr:flagellar protein FlaG [Paenibacillus polymyxa]MCV9949807.1 flagellar protein FlaG [Paenibacillus sp. BT-177]AHM68231.1 flagellar protein flag protein [Paenibacillus polymyxa SQR-21]AIY08967.1 flagellar protein FlaG [Paenibacillus polymyxa]MDU8673302.1 flagellar protein FlaG [Paenibacillus polymyxa]MDU8698208.1 flagellar protein FlaG [Paenibacillus polymyxa]